MNVTQLFSRLRLPPEGRMPALNGATDWLNTKPLTSTDLHGNVVNDWALAGDWTIGLEEAVSNEANAGIAFRFHARDLHLILVPPVRHHSARFRVLLDGRAPGDAHGLDIDDEGNGVVRAPRLYQLIRQRGHVTDRHFEIAFVDPGAAALCFTFG